MKSKQTQLYFTLGMITGLAVAGAFEVAGYRPLMQLSLPWWLYAGMAILAIGLAVYYKRRD